MPVGTQATVKGLTPDQLDDAGAQIILGNTYHLALRPGDELIAELGGLHRFMGWDGPILTDSGGFQVFSLADIRKIDDHGAVFRSHIDGRLLELTPERAVAHPGEPRLRHRHVPGRVPAGRRRRRTTMREAVRRTIHWAERCRDAHRRADQALFAIVQGGTDIATAGRVCRGPGRSSTSPATPWAASASARRRSRCWRRWRRRPPLLPADKPRYLMGVGRPEDMLDGVAAGIDMFDCVLPTRNGRNASAFTADGPLRLRNACHQRDSGPAGVRLSLLHLPALQPGVPASPVPGRRDARADAAVAAQRRVLSAADAGDAASNSGAAVRGVSGEMYCQVGRLAAKAQA